MVLFSEEFSFEKRKAEADRILKKYPDRIPIICEKQKNSNIEQIDKKKFLVPGDLTIGQFIFILRKRIKVKPEQAIFLFVNNILPPVGTEINSIYDEQKGEDGFLTIYYSGENTFGK